MDIKQLIKKKRVFIPCVLLLLYTLIGFFILPAVSKKLIVNGLQKSLQRSVMIESIKVNPYTLTAAVNMLAIKEKDSTPFFSADQIVVNAQMSSIFTLSAVISNILIEKPFIKLTRYTDNSFNFSDLTAGSKNGGDTAARTDKSSEIPRFTIKDIRISQGRIDFDDRVAGVVNRIDDLSFVVPFISSKQKDRENQVQSDIGLIMNRSELEIKVETMPFSQGLSSRVGFKTGDIDLLHYRSYIPVPDDLDIKDIDVNLNIDVTFKKENDRSKVGLQGRLNILNTDITASNGDPLIKVPSIAIEAEIEDIFAKQLKIPVCTIISPEITLKRDEKGQINLEKYFPKKAEGNSNDTPPENKNQDETAFETTVDSFRIENAKINFQDVSGAGQFNTKLSELNVKAVDMHIGRQVSGTVGVDFKTESNEHFNTQGSLLTHPLKYDGNLTLSGIRLNKYAPYYNNYIYFDVSEGMLTLDSDILIENKDDQVDMDIDVKMVSMSSLTLEDRATKESMLSLPEVNISKIELRLPERSLHTGRIELNDGRLLLKRMEDGQINLAGPMEKPQSTDIGPANENSENDLNKEKNSPWKIALDDLGLNNFSIDFHDNAPSDPVTISLSKIDIGAKNLKTHADSQGEISVQMKVNEQGNIRVNGSLSPGKPSAAFDVVLDKFDIESVQPYFTDAVKIMVTQGHLNGSGHIGFDMGDKNNPEFMFAGEVFISDFVSLDKITAKDFFKCRSFYWSGIDFSMFPLSLQVKDVALTDFYSRIIVHENGILNLRGVFKSDKKGPDDKPADPIDSDEAGPDMKVKVDSVTLQGGTISFTDLLSKPKFNAEMKEIVGSVTGLSSNDDTRAKLHLKGRHGHSAPLDIVGTINPLAEKRFADIGISFKDIEMSRFTPYSSKYLGYEIEKGKLILDLEYLINGNQLTSQNRVKFDNFTLGQSVKSEHATSLPVGLAISLLKDSNDQINLDLPVSGQLDDPEFKIGAIVFKMISNLIIKVVTSPFSIIGSMFGGGEDLGYVEFSHGQSGLDEPDTQKLDTLARILADKPSVKLEIQGAYQVENDSQVLKKQAFNDLLKAEKLKSSVKQGNKVAELSEIKLDPEEIDELINSAYQQASFPKPRHDDGKEKQVELEEKRKLLLTHINISKDDLRLLAMKRSQIIKQYLTEKGGVERERIYLLEPTESETPEKAEETKVTFLLK